MDKNMTKRAQITTDDADLPEDQMLDIGKDADIDEIYVVQGESMNDDRLKNLLKEESEMRKFMEEKITFSIAESADPNAPNPVVCGVNGEVRRFFRGQQYVAERKFLDSLIRVTRTVKTRQIKDAEGLDDTVIDSKFSHVNAISILNDPSGERGNRWFLFQQKNAF